MLAHASNVRSVCAWVVIAPFGFPVVPDVKMMSDTSSGPTASARARASSLDTSLAPTRKSANAVLPSGASPCSTITCSSVSGMPASRSMAT